MSASLIEELEKLLNETNHEKKRLNFICETVWDLLNPPGTEKNGLFNIEKKDMAPQLVQDCEETSNTSSSLESLESISKLIALGKLIREETKCEKKKSVHPVLEACNSTSLPKKEKLKTVTQVGCDKKISSCKGLAGINKCLKQNTLMKSDFLSDKKDNRLKTNLLTRPEKRKAKEVNSDFTSHNKNVTEVSLSTESNTAFSKAYSHLCSLTLSNFVQTLKMPEDLRYVLKHHNYYEKYKTNLIFPEKNDKPNFQTFRGRFHNVIKLKLNNDLKTNIKHTERYLKYLDIAEEITETKSKSGDLYHKVEYSSIDDLQLHGRKIHHLIDLKIKLRLLSNVCNQLSN